MKKAFLLLIALVSMTALLTACGGGKSGNSSVMIGPWNTPGTYSIYCTIHPNMMLKVTVQ